MQYLLPSDLMRCQDWERQCTVAFARTWRHVICCRSVVTYPVGYPRLDKMLPSVIKVLAPSREIGREPAAGRDLWWWPSVQRHGVVWQCGGRSVFHRRVVCRRSVAAMWNNSSGFELDRKFLSFFFLTGIQAHFRLWSRFIFCRNLWRTYTLVVPTGSVLETLPVLWISYFCN